jgi:hypothetical protein
MPKNLDRDMYVGTNVLFFAATNLMKAPAFLALGQLSVSQLKTTLIFFPLGWHPAGWEFVWSGPSMSGSSISQLH